MVKHLVLGLCGVFIGLMSIISSSYAISFADYAYMTARQGRLSTLASYIAKGYSIDAVDANGMTALCQAVVRKDYATYQKLKNLGASSNVDCMKRVENTAAQRYETGYAKTSNRAVSAGSGSLISGDTATYAGIGLLAAGGVAAAIALSNGGGSSHKSHSQKTCPAGTHLVGDTCVADHNCVDGERWDGTKCVAMECPAGTHLVGSECVAIDT